MPLQIVQARVSDFDSNPLQSTSEHKETADQSEEFVSDFSDEDFNAEEDLERIAVKFVEDFQTWLNQNKEF